MPMLDKPVVLGKRGLPFDHFLICSPQSPPEVLDLINKPQLWSAHPEEEQPLYHVLILVGEEHYPQVVDFIEEARRFGISRQIRANFPFEKLTAGKSQMVLLHPKAINLNWEQQIPPDYCPKSNPAHLHLQPPLPLTCTTTGSP